MTRLMKPTRKLLVRNKKQGKRTGGAKGTVVVVICTAFGAWLILLARHYRFGSIITDAYEFAQQLEKDPTSAAAGAASTPQKTAGDANQFDPPICTDDQLRTLKAQLKPDYCEKSYIYPFMNRCSFSWATSCHDNPWIKRYLAQPKAAVEEPFVSFFVGCNKAIDAIFALRVGSRNPKFDVDKWKSTLAKGGEFAQSSCDQFKKDYSIVGESKQTRQAQVYCFEPVTSTFAELLRSKGELGWANELVLEEAALSSHPGTMSVPKDTPLGNENLGINKLQCKNKDCRQVPIYTLNDYMDSMPGKPQIQYLSIDVEGYDFEVLKGASNVLSQVHYLEFEYNWRGAWKDQHLEDAINMLYGFGFICYWPGKKHEQIWRITGCWQTHYARRFWSNIACVNGKIPDARSLAEDMEEKFLKTLANPNVSY